MLNLNWVWQGWWWINFFLSAPTSYSAAVKMAETEKPPTAFPLHSPIHRILSHNTSRWSVLVEAGHWAWSTWAKTTLTQKVDNGVCLPYSWIFTRYSVYITPVCCIGCLPATVPVWCTVGLPAVTQANEVMLPLAKNISHCICQRVELLFLCHLLLCIVTDFQEQSVYSYSATCCCPFVWQA